MMCSMTVMEILFPQNAARYGISYTVHGLLKGENPWYSSSCTWICTGCLSRVSSNFWICSENYLSILKLLFILNWLLIISKRCHTFHFSWKICILALWQPGYLSLSLTSLIWCEKQKFFISAEKYVYWHCGSLGISLCLSLLWSGVKNNIFATTKKQQIAFLIVWPGSGMLIFFLQTGLTC